MVGIIVCVYIKLLDIIAINNNFNASFNMLRIFFISWALVCSLVVSSGLQAEQPSTEKPSAEQREEMASALLKIQVHILAVSPHVNAEAFSLLAEVADPAIADTAVAEAVKSIMLKSIAKDEEAKDEQGLEKQMRAFAQKIDIEFKQLVEITQKGTDDKDVLEKIWQQEQISAEEWVSINAKVRKAMISEQRLMVLNSLPVQLYRNFAMLAVAGRGILARQQEQADGEESKLLGTDNLFKAIKSNYDALVEFGLEEGLLTPEKYAAPEALTTELATSVDAFVTNINARSRHAGARFFQEKVSGVKENSSS